MSQSYWMLHSPYYPKASELLPEITSHSNIGPWPTFCKTLHSQSLTVWKMRRQSIDWMISYWWQSAVVTHLPFCQSPSWSDPPVNCCFSPIAHAHQALSQILLTSPISACQTYTRSPSKCIFPSSLVWSLPWLSQTGKVFLLLYVYQAVCAQPLELPSFCRVWWIFVSAQVYHITYVAPS